MSKKRIAVVCGKVCEAPIGDYFVTCSFDPNHVILRSRMPYHIIKCIKQHPGHDKIQCPYDSTEYIDPDQYENHVLNCESRRSLADGKFETAWLKANNRMCNLQQTPFFHEHAPEPDEDWDEDPATEVEGPAAEVEGPAAEVEGPTTEVEEYNEDLFEDLRPVGRGTGRGAGPRNQNQGPKKGMGRAEMMKHIFEIYKQRKSASNHSSSSQSRQDVCSGQFEDP